MIVKDEEANLPRCLSSVGGLLDEIIVVDTGSTDGTKGIATQFGARVFDFAWVDDFSAARNESLRLATGSWIFWLDADEWLDDDSRQRMRALLLSLPDENTGYVMMQRSPTQSLYLGAPGERGAQVVEQVRLFRNDPMIRWEGRVFEQIRPAIRRSGGTVRATDIFIQHSGYEEYVGNRQKVERNLRLARLQDAEHPDDPYTLAHIGDLLFALGRVVESVPYFQRSLETLPPSAAIRACAAASLAKARLVLGKQGKAHS